MLSTVVVVKVAHLFFFVCLFVFTLFALFVIQLRLLGLKSDLLRYCSSQFFHMNLKEISNVMTGSECALILF